MRRAVHALFDIRVCQNDLQCRQEKAFFEIFMISPLTVAYADYVNVPLKPVARQQT